MIGSDRLLGNCKEEQDVRISMYRYSTCTYIINGNISETLTWTLSLLHQTTEQAPASPKSTTRCVRARWAASCALRPCAVPLWGVLGGTPVRCAWPSPSPAVEASSPTSALEPARVSVFTIAIKAKRLNHTHSITPISALTSCYLSSCRSNCLASLDFK